MILKLEDISFTGTATHFKRWKIHPKIKDFNHEFASGRAYHILSDNSDNSWALCWIMGGILAPQKGKIYVDDTTYDLSAHRKDFWLVQYDEVKRFGLFSQSVQQQIQHGIKHYPGNFTEEDYIKYFQLSESRYHRTILQQSSEILRASCAIGFANQKHIFCFPDLEERIIQEYGELWFFELIQLLKNANKILLLQFPSSVNMAGICDEIISLDN